MESLVEGELLRLLNEQGIQVINTHPNVKHQSEKDQYEYDIIATNGKEIAVVEVKTTLRVQHIKYFLEDLKKFTVCLPVIFSLLLFQLAYSDFCNKEKRALLEAKKKERLLKSELDKINTVSRSN